MLIDLESQSSFLHHEAYVYKKLQLLIIIWDKRLKNRWRDIAEIGRERATNIFFLLLNASPFSKHVQYAQEKSLRSLKGRPPLHPFVRKEVIFAREL